MKFKDIFFCLIFLFSFLIKEKIPIYLYAYGQYHANYSLLIIERDTKLELQLLKAGL